MPRRLVRSLFASSFACGITPSALSADLFLPHGPDRLQLPRVLLLVVAISLLPATALAQANNEPIRDVSDLEGRWITDYYRFITMDVAADGTFVAHSKGRKEHEGCKTYGKLTFDKKQKTLGLEPTKDSADRVRKRLAKAFRNSKKLLHKLEEQTSRSWSDLRRYALLCVPVSDETARTKAQRELRRDKKMDQAACDTARDGLEKTPEDRRAFGELAELVWTIHEAKEGLDERCTKLPGQMKILPGHPDPHGTAFIPWHGRDWLIGIFGENEYHLVLWREGTGGPPSIRTEGEKSMRMTGRWLVRGPDKWAKTGRGSLLVQPNGRFVWRWGLSGCVVRGLVEEATHSRVTFRRGRGTTCRGVKKRWTRKVYNSAPDRYEFSSEDFSSYQYLIRMTR